MAVVGGGGEQGEEAREDEHDSAFRSSRCPEEEAAGANGGPGKSPQLETAHERKTGRSFRLVSEDNRRCDSCPSIVRVSVRHGDPTIQRSAHAPVGEVAAIWLVRAPAFLSYIGERCAECQRELNRDVNG